AARRTPGAGRRPAPGASSPRGRRRTPPPRRPGRSRSPPPRRGRTAPGGARTGRAGAWAGPTASACPARRRGRWPTADAGSCPRCSAPTGRSRGTGHAPGGHAPAVPATSRSVAPPTSATQVTSWDTDVTRRSTPRPRAASRATSSGRLPAESLQITAPAQPATSSASPSSDSRALSPPDANMSSSPLRVMVARSPSRMTSTVKEPGWSEVTRQAYGRRATNRSRRAAHGRRDLEAHHGAALGGVDRHVDRARPHDAHAAAAAAVGRPAPPPPAVVAHGGDDAVVGGRQLDLDRPALGAVGVLDRVGDGLAHGEEDHHLRLVGEPERGEPPPQRGAHLGERG